MRKGRAEILEDSSEKQKVLLLFMKSQTGEI